MATEGQTAIGTEKPGTTAAAAAATTAAQPATDKTATATQGTDKPADNGTDPADKTAGPTSDASAVARSIIDGVDDEDADGDDAEADAGAEPDKKAAAGDFPDDWREKLAAGNEKVLARLKRYKSPHDFANAGLAAQDKIRSKDYTAKLPDDATPEQIAEWRQANDIPKDAKEYDIPKVAGHEWTEADTPVLDSFKDAAHKLNLPKGAVAGVAEWYARQIEAAKEQHQAALTEKDRSDKTATEDALRARLGGEYRPSIQLFSRLLKDPEVFPEGTANRLANARFDDGTRVINDPAIADFFIGMARERYGDASFISGDAKAAMAGEEEQARTIMKTDFERYLREGWDKKLAAVLEKKEGKKGSSSHYTD